MIEEEVLACWRFTTFVEVRPPKFTKNLQPAGFYPTLAELSHRRMTPLKNRILPLKLIVAAILWSSGEFSPAYMLENLFWPEGAKVVMQLGLGASPVSLQDGFSTFNASAADAAGIWNGYLDFITFSTAASVAVPQVSGDNVNSAFFSDTVFGDSFGDGTLAVTVLLYTGSTTETEADVVVNTQYQFDSYRGPKQTGLNDFHRVMLHEFGHVLGLDHVTLHPAGQAIMEPVISNLDHLGADDIAGIKALYAAKITTSPGPVFPRQDDAFDYDSFAANNKPISWSAIGLPPGFTIDAATGHIAGITPPTGKYTPVITAHGPIADAYATFSMTVEGFNQVPGLLKILPLDAYYVVADPIRPRFYTSGPSGVSMIDVDTFEITNLVSETNYIWAPSLSPDSSQLLLLGSFPGYSLLKKIDLDSLSVMPGKVITSGSYEFYATPLVAGLDGRDYAAGDTDVVQFDDITGVLQKKFATVFSRPYLAISPDRKTLFVSDVGYPKGPASFSSYDISTPEPVLLQQTDQPYFHLTYAGDGQTLYGLGGIKPIVQIDPSTLQEVTSFGTVKGNLASLAISPDGPIFTLGEPLFTGSGWWQTWDPISFQQTADVEFKNLSPTLDINSPNFRSYTPVNFALDSTGKYLGCAIYVYFTGPNAQEVWLFSTDLAAFPPPPSNPTKDLANISTRVNLTTGQGSLIGGFIIEGSKPKKVLIRGLGPSLPLTGALGDPVLTLYDSSGTQIASNDNWTSSRLAILGTQLAPASERESAILTTLPPGDYTAIVQDHDNQPGLALVEAYDLDPTDSALANISTRGQVGIGDDVMIGGFIVGGQDPTNLLVRALGPSLAKSGIESPLSDPVLEIHDASGSLIMSNDNWRTTQESEIAATGIPPANDLESAIFLSLSPGSYTAIVHGQSDSTGIALVEVYNLDANAAE
jgi:hypothetical protein